ncbi:MAG TPA: dihydrolipoyl dehydrogenase [Steroidobacteraceae bacterium]|nr:dihydrolipoyl dehydrogenase [Steroidobacteraceae bacterium]
MSLEEIACPDIGNFTDVLVIDVLVKPGDQIALETPLVTLETDKATMDVPATAAGRVVEVLVARGDKISQGTKLVRVETLAKAAAAPIASPVPVPVAAPVAAPAPMAAAQADPGADREVQLLVLGAGPGGYTAAFRAADLGLQVILVERWPTLGGVCLNVGCIPSKALLHAARVIEEAREMSAHGVEFGAPRVDFGKLRAWKGKVVGKLTGGLTGLAKQRKVEIARGTGRFLSPHVMEIEDQGQRQRQRIRFAQCVIAAGSEPIALPFMPRDERVMDSTGALELPDSPGRLLVIGGGIIGLEMATVYEALGAKLSVVELTAQLMPGCDLDLVRPLEKRLRARYEQILLGTKVTAVAAQADGLQVSFEGPGGATVQRFDRVLVAVGRVPNGRLLGAEAAGVQVDGRGFIAVDRQQRTNVAHIFAIGDVVGQPMLAHKATHEGKVAAEVAAGQKSHFDARVIPSVAYTDPEIAWAGVTETTAKAQGSVVEKTVFPWAASGRSLSLGRDEGFTKLLFDPATQRIVGGGIVGTNAGELISEVALAIEMGADAHDVGLTVHPHPTLSETVAMAAEAFAGTLTDLYLPKKRPGH